MLLATLVLLLAQEAGVREASAQYPCARPATLVRFFHLATDAPDLAKVNAALRELGAELAHGPATTSGWPGNAFVAVRAPAGVEARALASALKKGGGAAQLLALTAFDGRTGSDHDFGLSGFGVTKRDMVRGISSDVTWYEARGTWSQFYGKTGKLEAEELAERYAKLYAPYGGAQLGAVVRERFTWTLTRAPEEKARAALLKKLQKIAGVEEAALAGERLTVTVRLADLEACPDLGPLPGDGTPLDEASASSPRAAYDVTALHDLLRGEGLVP
ncbi:MAG TPA: hypothetical protein VF530_08330 [Planctomycetota bacterium]